MSERARALEQAAQYRAIALDAIAAWQGQDDRADDKHRRGVSARTRAELRSRMLAVDAVLLAVDPPPSGASSQAETVAKLLLAARQVASFARAWEPLSPGDIRDLTKAIEAMDALPAPVSPVEPTRGTELCVPVLYQQPTILDVLKMEQGKLAKHDYGAPTDPVFTVRRRPVEPTPEPETCEWREKYNELLFAVERAYPGESRHETALRYIREKETVESCAPKAPLKVEREP